MKFLTIDTCTLQISGSVGDDASPLTDLKRYAFGKEGLLMQMRYTRLLTGPTVSMIAIGVTATPSFAQSDSAPPSALVNQRSQDTLEAARAASPQTSESTFAYFETEVQESLANALESVWDPERPRENGPRTS